MQIHFEKYQGTGNDFIMVDDRSLTFPQNDTSLIARLCDRRFGIGADGLILLQDDKISGLKMVYYNSDGNTSSMCGNGGRCFAAFAKKLGLVSDSIAFDAADGPHSATIASDGTVSLGMADVSRIDIFPDHTFLDTGSPHHIEMSDNLMKIDIRKQGAEIRYGELYGTAGSNVNFVHPETDGTFSIRTYERGVEDETLSCGTGATAAAIAMHVLGKTSRNRIGINVMGGKLEVDFTAKAGKYTDVLLIGPAEFVFKGEITC
ncbi:diaminopimelate epimerase [Flavobacterium silvaticum]|uniref:Diaminopimelate epimerase n=1 Tax=Flavobacterium silvaticum TaxID=1852020 RepID=A0A972G067_9FLAO|nr:diaminopimelate epimerase [Flavobacterium silvaticum]NMH28026.1 diaminopimelate epimerase [Flavobacterium silvaticum]